MNMNVQSYQIRPGLTLALVVLCTSFLMAQTAEKTSTPTSTPQTRTSPSPTPKPPERPRQLVQLISDARLAAPELCADVILKRLESNKIADVAWSKELLDEVLRLADEVKDPFRLYFALPKGLPVNRTEAYTITV